MQLTRRCANAMPGGVTHCFPLHIIMSRTGTQMYTVRRMRCVWGGGHIEHPGRGGKGNRKGRTGVSWGETEGKRTLGEPRHRCENVNTIDL
jgi:hypothetical protein